MKLRKDLIDPSDKIGNCISKIALLGNFFHNNVPDDELFSEKGILGFKLILGDLEDDLVSIVDELRQLT
jgi:hypothetical protein